MSGLEIHVAMLTVYINTVAANALGHVTKSARAVVARALPETLVPTASRRP